MLLNCKIKEKRIEDLINDGAILVFPDIINMYPSVDVKEAIQIIMKCYNVDPSDIGWKTDELGEA